MMNAFKTYFHPADKEPKYVDPKKRPSLEHSTDPLPRRISRSESISQAARSYFHPAPGERVENNPEERSPMGNTRNTSSRERSGSGSSYHQTTSSLPPPTPLSSNYPHGDFRNSTFAQIVEIKSDVTVNWMYAQQVENLWNQGTFGEGVVLKKTRDSYTCCPKELMHERNGLFDAVTQLNVRCAMTVNTRVIKLFLRRQDQSSVSLTQSLKLQILPSISDLPQCRKHHFAAFIQDPAVLVVWDDDPKHILEQTRRLEKQLMAMVWKGGSAYGEEKIEDNKEPPLVSGEDVDEAPEALLDKPRKIILIQASITAATLAMIITAIGGGFRRVAVEIMIDHNWLRLALIVAVPIQIWLGLFFMQTIATCVAQVIGPISQTTSNSRFYSGKAPRRIRSKALPHVTIQCPVYKESLNSVIDPTVKSIKAAISTYEMQGGSANIFINDDGMQLISEGDAQARQDYYEEHNVGWVARPKHSPKPTDGTIPFIRPGKFKKASNMNYALAVSARVEDKLAIATRPHDWTQENEKQVYNTAFQAVVLEDQGRTWAEGNIRIGDYILLIDSDTRVPSDCLLDAVSEMEASPQVAILQYTSGVVNVTTSFFERGITFFTNLIYTAIQFAVANGDVAPFVGHNAILRWSAIQNIAYEGEDGTEKYWSESTVSEDFEMALRLQCSGYLIRLAAYTGQGFKEGVSLTVYDELARWEKYAYGCSELIFHPFKDWLFKGPFTPLFGYFIRSSMPFPSKITIMAYIGTYYAIGSAFPLTLLNYFLIGWFNGHYDHYYLDSFKIYFSIVVIFNGLGNVALAVLRYRVEERGLFSSLLENLKYVPLLTIFLGGLSLHLSQAILSHLLGIPMSWGATAKEAAASTFFDELPKVFRKFKVTVFICLLTFAGMIFLGAGLGGGAEGWSIGTFTAIWPLATCVSCHLLLPVVLNPGLMLFTW